jgi:hypothetical protein
MFLLDSNPNIHSYLGNNSVYSIQQSMAYIEKLRLNSLKMLFVDIVPRKRMSLLAGQI